MSLVLHRSTESTSTFAEGIVGDPKILLVVAAALIIARPTPCQSDGFPICHVGVLFIIAPCHRESVG